MVSWAEHQSQLQCYCFHGKPSSLSRASSWYAIEIDPRVGAVGVQEG